MTQEEFNVQLWRDGKFDEYAAGLIRRAEGFEMLADAPGQEPREIWAHRKSSRTARGSRMDALHRRRSMRSMDDLFDTNGAEVGQAGYAYHQAVEAAKGATVEDPFENLSDEELLAHWKKEAQKELAKRRDQDSFEAARVFVAECPECVENPKNARLMSEYIEAAIGKDATPSVDDLHSAFDALNGENFSRCATFRVNRAQSSRTPTSTAGRWKTSKIWSEPKVAIPVA